MALLMSCTNSTWDFRKPYGSTLRYLLTWTDTVDGEKVPVDLTFATATWTVTVPRTGTQVFQLTHLSGLTLGGTAGTIQLFKQLGATAKGRYEHRLVITFPSGDVKVPVVGELVIF